MNETRAEFYLSLARAFLVPDDRMYAGVKDYLADDLSEMASELGYPIAEPIERLRAVAAELTGALELLQTYSALFVQPPRKVPINAALYLDGAILGRSVDAMERVYLNHGMERAEAFRDTADHLGLQLEFLAYLFAGAARDPTHGDAIVEDTRAFIREFMLSWVPMFARRVRDATAELGCPDVYRHLSAILEGALQADAGEIPDDLWQLMDPARAQAAAPAQRAMATCTRCGADIAPAGRVRRVRKLLEKEGIDVSHLELCVACRGGAGIAQSLSARTMV